MEPRARVVAFGSAAALAVVGGVCGALVGGLIGQVLAIALVSVGLGGVVLLLFYEVGLSEDHERAREEQRRARPEQRRSRLRRPPRRRR